MAIWGATTMPSLAADWSCVKISNPSLRHLFQIMNGTMQQNPLLFEPVARPPFAAQKNCRQFQMTSVFDNKLQITWYNLLANSIGAITKTVTDRYFTKYFIRDGWVANWDKITINKCSP